MGVHSSSRLTRARALTELWTDRRPKSLELISRPIMGVSDRAGPQPRDDGSNARTPGGGRRRRTRVRTGDHGRETRPRAARSPTGGAGLVVCRRMASGTRPSRRPHRRRRSRAASPPVASPPAPASPGFLVTIGDIGVTPDYVVTPNGVTPRRFAMDRDRHVAHATRRSRPGRSSARSRSRSSA